MKYYLGLILFCFSFYSLANESPDGNILFQKHCSECHQKDGNSDDKDIPKIAGFSAILIYDILDQFKSGHRQAQQIKNKDGQTTDMIIISKALGSEEIEAISHYLSAQASKALVQKFDQEMANEGKSIHLDLCENCHVDEGTNPIEDAPLLRHQWKSYLIKQFELFSNRSRDVPRRMKKRFRKLSESDKKELIEFYISPISTN